MGNNKDPNEKRPGENEEGKFHYNPGNMAGKEMGIRKKAEEQVKADKKKNRPEHDDRKV
jgi:hypothetical protein